MRLRRGFRQSPRLGNFGDIWLGFEPRLSLRSTEHDVHSAALPSEPQEKTAKGHPRWIIGTEAGLVDLARGSMVLEGSPRVPFSTLEEAPFPCFDLPRYQQANATSQHVDDA